MVAMSVSHISAYEKEKNKRKETLNKLTSEKFDSSNPSVQTALRQYMNEFELSCNKMYLFQAMSEGLKVWGTLGIANLLLPIPGFISVFTNACFYFGVSGFILERFSMTDFVDDLNEMKQLYKWSVKDNPEKEAKFVNPDLQRLIKLLAPLCTEDFMLAWDKELNQSTEADNSLTKKGAAIVSSVYSLFSTSKDKVDPTKVRELKIAVENRSFDKNVYTGLEQAIKYFATDTEFKNLMRSQLSSVVENMKNMVPTAMGKSNAQ
ncbi:MAG: hypothetical protein WC627_03165 [Legionella sp.]|jgi:hypothetical protein